MVNAVLLKKLRIRSDAKELYCLKEQLGRLLEKKDISGDCIWDIQVAVHEACVYVIKHPCGSDNPDGEIFLEIYDQQSAMVLYLTHYAEPNLKGVCIGEPRADTGPIGFCRDIMDGTMDEIEFLKLPDGVGSIVKMTKNFDRETRSSE